MAESAAEPTWFTDVNGVRLGVQPVKNERGTFVRLLLPDRREEKLLDAEDAARLIEMLQRGIAFSEITGAHSFRVHPDEI